MLNRKVLYFLIIIFIAIITLIPNFGTIVENNVYAESTCENDAVWWNTTELSTESYTAPFFEVYKLKDYGQMAFGLDVADFNGDGLDDVVVGGVQGDVRLLINNQTLVNVVKPEDRLLYFFGNDDYSLRFPGTKVVVGGIEVVAWGLEPLSRVDFYVDGVLVKSDNERPFSWNWTTLGFRQYMVYAEAFDLDGDFAGRDSFLVWKFL